jgi:hypothetical protein
MRAMKDRTTHLLLCAECHYAQLFAVQPRLLCTLHGAPTEGQVLFAGQPGCVHMVPRADSDVELAWCAPGQKAAPSRIPHGATHAA